MTLQTAGLFLLIVLGFGRAVPVLLLNTYLSIRFYVAIRARSREKMPFLPFDFGGRWQRVFATPNADPLLERIRRHLLFWQRLLFAPLVFALLGVALVTLASR